jgi:hypothetical protein
VQIEFSGDRGYAIVATDARDALPVPLQPRRAGACMGCLRLGTIIHKLAKHSLTDGLTMWDRFQTHLMLAEITHGSMHLSAHLGLSK